MNSQQVFIPLKALNQAKVRSTVHLKGFKGVIFSDFLAFFLFGIRYLILSFFNLLLIALVE
ncbi:hypothetical protein LEP1GSC036_3425 [Leptospira weilii str. 2006001853]|uniref:Uncharacterized protein n=1 Tax=Leptospira weilii str. 2006001853 TaxID=1001589 RepID=A0A828Z070_9LEPT|nr:hypothetical protein LEP1GSC036_3425 [Leptospira weilii str. 2006001853]